jgi:hypothetical protein
MKLGCLAEGAIVRRSNGDRHLVDTAILAAVEADVRFGPRAHYKGEN